MGNQLESLMAEWLVFLFLNFITSFYATSYMMERVLLCGRKKFFPITINTEKRIKICDIIHF